MKIAVEGCAHGELDAIYATIEQLTKDNNMQVDLLICCGDFQSVRNYDDLTSMAVPAKYQQLNTFYKYYSGEKVAPVLTLFIGGNHEASSYLFELPFGGWVAPNIYFLGYAGCVRFGNVRIAGLSGIYKGYDYARGRFEMPPFTPDSKKSCYHIRTMDVFRLKQLSGSLDIGLSHDWPRGIPPPPERVAISVQDQPTDVGTTVQCNGEGLMRRKTFLREDIESGKLGSRPTRELLATLKPTYWFAAHLHVKFAALVTFPDNRQTRFLALDKCLPHRDFLQVVEFPSETPSDPSDTSTIPKLCYDPEWLAILRNTDHLWSFTNKPNYMPGPGGDERHNFTPTTEEIGQVHQLCNGNLVIPLNFSHTAPPLRGNIATPKNKRQSHGGNIPVYVNPQTTEFCAMLGIQDYNHRVTSENSHLLASPFKSSSVRSSGGFTDFLSPRNSQQDPNVTMDPLQDSLNPDEISILDDDDDNDNNSCTSFEPSNLTETSYIDNQNGLISIKNTGSEGVENVAGFFIDRSPAVSLQNGVGQNGSRLNASPNPGPRKSGLCLPPPTGLKLDGGHVETVTGTDSINNYVNIHSGEAPTRLLDKSEKGDQAHRDSLPAGLIDISGAKASKTDEDSRSEGETPSPPKLSRVIVESDKPTEEHGKKFAEVNVEGVSEPIEAFGGTPMKMGGLKLKRRNASMYEASED